MLTYNFSYLVIAALFLLLSELIIKKLFFKPKTLDVLAFIILIILNFKTTNNENTNYAYQNTFALVC